MALDLTALYANDYLRWDNVKQLTVTTDRHTNEGGDKSDIVGYCKPATLQQSLRAFGSIQVSGEEISWIIPDALLLNIGSQGLRSGDKLTDLSVTPNIVYTILRAQRVNFDTAWLLMTIKRK